MSTDTYSFIQIQKLERLLERAEKTGDKLAVLNLRAQIAKLRRS